MTTIVNGATKARLVWILSQIANLQNWIQPDGQTILSGVQIELQDIVNGATEPATVAPTTEIQAVPLDEVNDLTNEIVFKVTNIITAARADILASIAAIPAPAPAAPAVAATTAAPTTDTTTAPAAADPAPAATATA